MKKYAALADYLRTSEADRVELSLEEIERIIGASLPASARTHEAWWENSTTHSQALAWLDAGFRASLAGCWPGRVVFRRGKPGNKVKTSPPTGQEPVDLSVSKRPATPRQISVRRVPSAIEAASTEDSPHPRQPVLEIEGVAFEFVTALNPDRGPDGSVLQYMPQAAYRNERRLPLNPHGQGPFCHFRIPSNLHREGVYALTVAGQVKYIGECEDLSRRFGPAGYGSIQPRSCFVRGQSTNCKLNHHVLEAAWQGHSVELWFHPTGERKRLESTLLGQVRPEWNGRFK